MRIPALLVLAVTLAGCGAHRSAKDITAIAKAADGAVVSITMLDINGQPIAQGSGFIISKDGCIVTNYHVIKTGSSAIVKLPNGAFFPVEGVLAFDKDRDIAVIKAHGEDFRTVPLGDSRRVEVGDEVIAIGNPLSLESTVSNGIISGIRTVREEGRDFLQVTTPISPGSSGGPLFNMDGQVVGITTMYLKGGENLNFAIPINDAKGLLALKFSKVQAFPMEAGTPQPGLPLSRDGTATPPAKVPVPPGATATPPAASATLAETLQWLQGATDENSGTGKSPFSHYMFEIMGRSGCSVAITETRDEAGPDWYDKRSFSLADIDPGDIHVENLGEGDTTGLLAGLSTVSFHTTNFRRTIIVSTKGPFFPGGPVLAKPMETPTSDSSVTTNDRFAPQFAKAFRRAVELCGGKRSSF
jgi:S1-C subfamily serine protease